MKKIKYLIILYTAIISCSEMETVIDLEIPTHNPVLVLNARLDTDTLVKVLISNSVGAFDTASPQMINNANVLLFENDIFIDSLEIDLTNTIFPYVRGDWNQIAMNYYKSNYIPVKDKTYRIEVKHQNFIDIIGSTYIPDDIMLKNIVVDTLSNSDRINYKFSFNDDINQTNYYALALNVNCNKSYVDEYGYEEDYSFSGGVEMSSNDPSFPVNDIFSGYTFVDDEVIFSDALFNGLEKNISIDIFYEDFKFGDCDTVNFEFSTFSNDAYTYFNSLENQRQGGLADIFGGEVVPVYTNITNGLGILISRNVQKVYIKP